MAGKKKKQEERKHKVRSKQRANFFCLKATTHALLIAGGAFSAQSAQSAPLNDSGITTFGDATNNNLPVEPVNYPGQDASYGRDAAAMAGMLTKLGGGRAGFDFTKLDNNGNELPASATNWVCLRDNATGLVWEVKTDDSGLRDKDSTYTWYNPDSLTNGGFAGSTYGGSCAGFSGCNTQSYIDDVNGQNLCGASDWRLPTVEELRSIIDYSVPFPGPLVDEDYLPNTNPGKYWSSVTTAETPTAASYLDFSGFEYGGSKSSTSFVRLVRRGQ